MIAKRRQHDEQQIRKEFQAKRPTLSQLQLSGEYTQPIPQREYLQFAQAVIRMRASRKAAGLSLAEVARRTGIDKAALSRLENGVADNPTVGTIHRYANAIGKSLVFQIVDLPRGHRNVKPTKHRLSSNTSKK